MVHLDDFLVHWHRCHKSYMQNYEASDPVHDSLHGQEKAIRKAYSDLAGAAAFNGLGVWEEKIREADATCFLCVLMILMSTPINKPWYIN